MARTIFCLLLLGFTFVSLPAEARRIQLVAPRQTQRQVIRQMPLLERPYRVGHFYGNTVRRIHYRTVTPMPAMGSSLPRRLGW